MASELSVVVLGEVAAERRPKLDAILLAKKEGLTAQGIQDRRIKGLDAFYQSVWRMKDKVRLSHPRDVDEEDLKLHVDQSVWKSLLDEDVDGEFPWAGIKPPRSRPHPGYANWFRDNAPAFEYPPLEERTQLWAELLNQAAYDDQCGPFEVQLPAFAWPLVDTGVLHALLADLPQGMRIATKPVDPARPDGLLNVAMSLEGPMEMDMASQLRAARMKSDLVRCFLILRLWAESLLPGASTPLEEYFVEAYSCHLGELPAPPVTTPAQQHIQPASADPSPASPSAGEQSRGGSWTGPASRGESFAGQESRGGSSRADIRGGLRDGTLAADLRSVVLAAALLLVAIVAAALIRGGKGGAETQRE